MTIYEDHDYIDLLDRLVDPLCKPIGFFKTFEDAEKWLLKRGKQIAKNFEEDISNIRCVFFIIEQDNLTDPDEIPNLYWQITEPTYAFSKKNYKMLMTENMIFCSRDHGKPNAEFIRLVKNGKIIFRGSDKKSFSRDSGFFEQYQKEYIEQYNEFQIQYNNKK